MLCNTVDSWTRSVAVHRGSFDGQRHIVLIGERQLEVDKVAVADARSFRSDPGDAVHGGHNVTEIQWREVLHLDVGRHHLVAREIHRTPGEWGEDTGCQRRIARV